MRGLPPTRRSFLLGAMSAALLTRAGYAAPGRPDATGRFPTGHVGLGQRGAQLLESTSFDPRAFFDVDTKQIKRAAPNARAGARVVASFRELISLADLDAVVIATPDHWHARLAIAAMEAGKDVYLETPCIWQPAEAKALLAAARRWGAVVQSGEPLPHTRAAAALKQKLAALPAGAPLTVNCKGPRNPVGGSLSSADPPEGFDWQQWLGHAENRPYNPDYAHANWRFLLDLGGGHLRALGTTQIATLLWAAGIEAPKSVTVSATGTAPTTGVWECPADFAAAFDIDGRIRLTWEQTEPDAESAPCAMRIEGAGEPMTLQGIDDKATLRTETTTIADAGWDTQSPLEHWTTCMSARLQPRLPLTTACAASTMSQLAVVAWRVGVPLTFDFASGKVSGSPLAERLLRSLPGGSDDAVR